MKMNNSIKGEDTNTATTTMEEDRVDDCNNNSGGTVAGASVVSSRSSSLRAPAAAVCLDPVPSAAFQLTSSSSYSTLPQLAPSLSSSISCIDGDDRSIDNDKGRLNCTAGSRSSDPNHVIVLKQEEEDKEEQNDKKEPRATTITPMKRKATTTPGKPMYSSTRNYAVVIPNNLETCSSTTAQRGSGGHGETEAAGVASLAADDDDCNKRKGRGSGIVLSSSSSSSSSRMTSLDSNNNNTSPYPKRILNDDDHNKKKNVSFRNNDKDTVHHTAGNDEIIAEAAKTKEKGGVSDATSSSSLVSLLLPHPSTTTSSSTKGAAQGGVAEQHPCHKRHKRDSNSSSSSSSSSLSDISLSRFASLASVAASTTAAVKKPRPPAVESSAAERMCDDAIDEGKDDRSSYHVLPLQQPASHTTEPTMALTAKVSVTASEEEEEEEATREKSIGAAASSHSSSPVALSNGKPVPRVTETTATTGTIKNMNESDDDDDDDDTPWDEYYYQAAFFKATQGHLNIPPDHVVCEGDDTGNNNSLQLGRWITQQRAKLSAYYHAAAETTTDNDESQKVPKAVQLKIKKLCDIGFEFYNAWETFYIQFLLFQQLHGHIDVPPDFVCQESRLPLGQWVAQQATDLATYLQSGTIGNDGELPTHITLHRIRKLVDIGLKTRLHDGWDALYAKVAQFKASHGHTKVPPDCLLGSWVGRQRVELSAFLQAGKNKSPVPKFMQLRIAKLIDIGFEFYNEWDTHLFQLEAFYASLGHTDVPLDYICKDNMLHLGNWVYEQRAELSAYIQTENENNRQTIPTYIQRCIGKLKRLGFDFLEGDDCYHAQLSMFKASEGHTRVLSNHVCKGHGLQLGKWVLNRRAVLSAHLQKGKESGVMPPHIKLCIQKLVDIGFEFYGPFDAYYMQLCLFQSLVGHTRVPADVICKDSQLELGKWVAIQRAELCAFSDRQDDNNVPAIPLDMQQRIRKLKRIGFVFHETFAA